MYFWQSHYKESQQQGGVASFVSWVSSGVTTISVPSLTEKLSSAQQFGWLSYLILDIETKTEEETKLWPLLRAELANDTKQSLDQGLKVRVQFMCPTVEIQIQMHTNFHGFVFIHNAQSKQRSKVFVVLFLNQKCVMKLKLEYSPGLNSLALYQWSRLAVAMEMDHPLLLLAWQNFFVLFLGRQVSQTT